MTISEDNDDEELIHVVLGGSGKTSFIDECVDDFDMPVSTIRKLNGLDKNFIRKADRRLKGRHGAGGSQSRQIETEEYKGYTYLDCVTPPHNLLYLAKLYDLSSAHRAAVDAKVNSVFGMGYEWVETDKYKRSKEKTRTDNGLKRAEQALRDIKDMMSEWIKNSNSEDCFEEVLQKIGKDYETLGNGYLEIGRTITGKIGYIGHIPAVNMRVRRERDGYVQIYSNTARFFRNFGDTTTQNPIGTDKIINEVIHFKKYSPSNTYYGVPEIMSAMHAVAGNEFASRYNLDYFENKAIPRYAIIVKGATLSDPSQRMLLEFFETGLKGKHHRSILVPLGKNEKAEVKFEAIESKTQESSFAEYRDDNNEEIFMSHRTPMTRAGVYAKGMSLAAAQSADKVFKESYSSPEQSIFEKKFNKIVAELTDMVMLSLNELSLTDADTQSKIDERNVRMGIDVADEVRSRNGKNPRPDGKGMDTWAPPNSQNAADEKAKAGKTRSRDAARSAGATDSNGTARNPKGAGRSTS